MQVEAAPSPGSRPILPLRPPMWAPTMGSLVWLTHVLGANRDTREAKWKSGEESWRPPAGDHPAGDCRRKQCRRGPERPVGNASRQRWREVGIRVDDRAQVGRVVGRGGAWSCGGEGGGRKHPRKAHVPPLEIVGGSRDTLGRDTSCGQPARQRPWALVPTGGVEEETPAQFHWAGAMWGGGGPTVLWAASGGEGLRPAWRAQ